MICRSKNPSACFVGILRALAHWTTRDSATSACSRDFLPEAKTRNELENSKMTTHSSFVSLQPPVHYHTVRLNELDVFYREAGAPDAPTILLLHGFPTSSNMFRNLIPRLAKSFHVVAPDYPGFGQSSMPDHHAFAYTFENLTNVVEQLVEKLGLTSYALYVMDYGAPVGYRLALRRPDRVQALIVQNGNAY